MSYKLNYLLCIILFINIKSLKTFNVNFNYNYNLPVEPCNTQIHKRESKPFFDKALFSFNGFEKVESIPVLFPLDICLFSLENIKYATALHIHRNGTRHFAVFKRSNVSYELLADIPTPKGIAMDCLSFNNKGYVAIAFQHNEPIQYATEGSPIYEIAGNSIRAVQYFAISNLISVYLRASGNDLFLLHTYDNSEETPNLHCPLFKWSGYTFNRMGRIPCSNARQLTPFSIDYESYVAVANYADQNGRTSTNSEIYKYSNDKNKFVLFQKIPTHGAVDVQYFSIPQNEARKHFLIFGNSKSRDPLAKKDGSNLDADSVIYLLDKGQFEPYQKLSFYAVKKFLPLQNVEAEKFILLVACTDQDIKIYNFNDWKFEESQVQFTEGALGKGVSNMRIYQEHEKTYLIIANSLMAANETNIFLPIFKQEEHANALRQKIIEWAKDQIQRLLIVNTQELGKLIEEKLKNFGEMKYLQSMQDIPKANIQSVNTESLIYPKLHMTTDYWLSLGYANQALDILETTLNEKQRLKRDAVSATKAQENVEQVFNTLNVKTLTVNKELKAKNVNRVRSSEPYFESIEAKKILVDNSFIKPTQERISPWENRYYIDDTDAIDEITFKNLKFTGKLNGYRMSDLINNTLKRKEEIQFLKSNIVIENLKADVVVVSGDKVNGYDLGFLVPIGGGQRVINQNIQFTNPITVHQLNILERLNNIHVFNGQFDVLLKKSNKTQVIEGVKNVTNIKVLDLINPAEKMMRSPLAAITPNKFIHEALVLQGNFMINGDVQINRQLNTLDIIDLNEKLSTKQILDMALRMDVNLKDVKLKFQQQLIANNSLVYFANQQNLQRLVQLNKDDIQLIEGFKVFNDTLEIRSGFSEVKNLNGIDIEDLEENAFLKNNNQTIKVPMKIGNISTKSIEGPTILLNSKNLRDYLTLTGNQSIEGSLIIDNLTADYLTVEHLNTDSKIFHQKLQDIYQQKSRNTPQEDFLKQNRKFHGSIYVQNLILNSTINNKSVDEIENQILQLGGNIKYVGDFKFNYPLNVTSMTFQGKLNGIQAEDFGKYWLQKNAEKQVFTVAQTLATINAEDGIFLQGKLNGLTLEELYTRTYWINRNENIQCVEFENPVEIATYLNTKTLNDYMVPHDVFYKNFRERPIVLKTMTVKENLRVEGRILNLTSINNINLKDLQIFLDSTTEPTLYVENAYFLQSPPMYKTLNSHNIRQTLSSIWLANDNVVLPHQIEMADAYFEGLLEFKGPINNINLDFLKANYFSKTKAQDVSTEIVFSEDVEIEKEIYTNDLQVLGSIKDRKSNSHSFEFNEFARSALKTSGPHIITGNWNLYNIKVEGSLNDVLINNLNLWNDIILKGKPSNIYELTAPKVFKAVHMENLYAESTNLVNRIPVANLVKDAVYLYENYTIKGVTTVNSLNIYNNLIVFGKLNNVTFNEHNLLLTNKKQTLPGSMKIASYLAKEKRFLTNNIEHLYADYINGQFITKFMENLIPNARNAEIDGNLSFKKVLKIEKYNGPEEFLVKRNTDKETIIKRQSFQSTHNVGKFEEVEDNLNKIKQNITYKLDHFDVVQIIPVKSSELLTLSIKSGNKLVDIMVLSDIQNKNVTFYKWMPTEKQFRKTKEFHWLPYDPLALKIIKKMFLPQQQPVEATILEIFISLNIGIFHGILVKANNFHDYFEFSNENCIRYQNKQITSFEINNYCIDTQSQVNIISSNGNVKQIQGMGQNNFAIIANSSILLYEINNYSNSSKLVQKLTVTEPQQMAFGSFNGFKFIAILSHAKSNSLKHGHVEIYRSSNSSGFTFLQSLKCFEPTQVTFSFIEKSSDFLIHILSDSFHKPYLIYQYVGVMGFKEILTDSMLPTNLFGFDIFNLYSSKHHLVALKAQENITIMELVLNQV